MKEKKSIQDKLRLNNIVVYCCLLMCMLFGLLYFLRMEQLDKQSREYVYVVDGLQGAAIQLRWVNRLDEIDIEAKSHLTMFVENYYSFNQNNIDVHRNKALSLGGECIYEMELNRNDEGYYNKLIQNNAVQNAELMPANIELYHNKDGSINFKIIITLEEIYRNVRYYTDKFCCGKLTRIDRQFPNNPHGLLVQEYLEEKTIKKATLNE